MVYRSNKLKKSQRNRKFKEKSKVLPRFSFAPYIYRQKKPDPAKETTVQEKNEIAARSSAQNFLEIEW